METNKDLCSLYEKYKKLTGNLQQEAAGMLTLAHVLLEILEALKGDANAKVSEHRV